MQFATLFTTVAAALVLGIEAAAINARQDRLAQFRSFGAEGCLDLNQGFYTVDTPDANTCKDLANAGGPVVSLELEQLNLPAANGCEFYIYTDTACSSGRRALSVGACNNPLNPGETWNSWQIACSTLAA